MRWPTRRGAISSAERSSSAATCPRSRRLRAWTAICRRRRSRAPSRASLNKEGQKHARAEARRKSTAKSGQLSRRHKGAKEKQDKEKILVSHEYGFRSPGKRSAPGISVRINFGPWMRAVRLSGLQTASSHPANHERRTLLFSAPPRERCF